MGLMEHRQFVPYSMCTLRQQIKISWWENGKTIYSGYDYFRIYYGSSSLHRLHRLHYLRVATGGYSKSWTEGRDIGNNTPFLYFHRSFNTSLLLLFVGSTTWQLSCPSTFLKCHWVLAATGTRALVWGQGYWKQYTWPVFLSQLQYFAIVAVC